MPGNVSFKKPTRSMITHFKRRTKEHIDGVVKYMNALEGFAGFSRTELSNRAQKHDRDKYADRALVLPYIWVTEYHRMENEEGGADEETQQQYDLARAATGKHIQQNPHHPEAHSDPSKMSNLDLAEMVADWSAMAEELNEGSARGWADKNVNSKWKFTPEQTEFIYDAITWLEGQQEAPFATTEAAYRRDRDAGPQEIELERLLGQLLPGTEFAGKVFAVGGYVRDQLQGLEPADLDVVVELPYGAQRFAGFLRDQFGDAVTPPKPLTYDFPIWFLRFVDNVVYNGDTFNVKGAEVDLTDSQTVERLDHDTTPRFGPLQRDVERRDFTVNMLFKDLTSGKLIDPTGVGRRDVERGLLRARPYTNVEQSFQDNPRQILRLLRFQTQYGWELDPGTARALEQALPCLEKLTKHDLQRELGKLQKRGLLKEVRTLLKNQDGWKHLQNAWRRERSMTTARTLTAQVLEHRRHKKSLDTGHVLLFADVERDDQRASNYGPHVWTLRTELPHVQDDPQLLEFARNYFEYSGLLMSDAELLAELNPQDIVNSAGVWDDPQFVSELWNTGHEPVGYRTDDGAVVLDYHAVELDYRYDDPNEW